MPKSGYVKPSDVKAKQRRVQAATPEALQRRADEKTAAVRELLAEIAAFRLKMQRLKELRELLREADLQAEMLEEVLREIKKTGEVYIPSPSRKTT